MTRRETKGGDLNLIRVLRHDLPREQLPIHFPWRVVGIMLTGIAGVEMAIRILGQ